MGVSVNMFIGITWLPAGSGPLFGRRRRYFCDSAARQSYVRALHTLGIAPCGPAGTVREGTARILFSALGETRRAGAIRFADAGVGRVSMKLFAMPRRDTFRCTLEVRLT